MRKQENFTRVTEILNPFTKFEHIEPAVLEKACERGSMVHRYCELYLKNLLIEPVREDCKPYFDSFLEWINFIKPEILHVEKRVYCEELKITGQIDLVCKYRNSSDIYIIDFKTPVQASPTWALQTSAYKYLAEKEFKIKIANRGCLMLDRKGYIPKFKMYDNEKDFELFSKALELYRFFNG